MTEREEHLFQFLERVHKGENLATIQMAFDKEFFKVTTEELVTAMEQLVHSGVRPDDARALVDVNSPLLKGKVSVTEVCDGDCGDCGELANEIANAARGLPSITANDVMIFENVGLRNALEFIQKLYSLDHQEKYEKRLVDMIRMLPLARRHYRKKEYLYLPYFYKHGRGDIADEMWPKDAHITSESRRLAGLVETISPYDIETEVQALVKDMLDMIPLEDSMLDEADKLFTLDEMLSIAEEYPNLGYAFLSMVPRKPMLGIGEKDSDDDGWFEDDIIHLPTGDITIKDLHAILNTLPVEITFVDKDGKFAYFNETSNKMFFRAKPELGMDFTLLHPEDLRPRIMAAFNLLKEGKKKDIAMFHNRGDRTVRVHYLRTEDNSHAFLGVLEIVQDVTDFAQNKDEK